MPYGMTKVVASATTTKAALQQEGQAHHLFTTRII
jgi:hypothetical protein